MNNSDNPILPVGLNEQTLDNLTTNLSDRQLLWLSGYLYGLSKNQNSVAAVQNIAAVSQTAPPQYLNPTLPQINGTVAQEAIKLTILYGSQTGNCKKAALMTAAKAAAKGIESKVVDMAEYAPKNLKDEKHLLVVVSTYGEGEPPAAAEELHGFLFGNRAPKLPDMQFSVLALGDKSYTQFCQTGIDFDVKLEKLGAKRLTPRVDCDVDWHDDGEKWADLVVEKLSVSVAANVPQLAGVGQNYNGNGNGHATTFVKNAPPQYIPAFDRKKPFHAPILEKIQLNGRGSTKETWHVELSLEGSGLQYEAGDALAVIPQNSERLVSEVLKATKLDPSVSVSFDGQNNNLGDVLMEKAELSVLNRDVLNRYFELTKNDALKQIISDPKAIQNYVYGRDIVDLVTEFPTEMTPQYLADILRKMPSRAYSIASSLEAHPEEVHLTVGAVRYSANGRKKEGVASTFLADRTDETVKVFIEKNEFFKLPKDHKTDIIMVGPGTGIAPFRAFVEERAETNAAGKNWLIFGNPHFETDFLYQTEWQQYLKKGVLSRLDVAFSRDQAEKIYVQHRILQKSKQIFDWLENGAMFYVCGDKTRMASDVERALVAVAEKEGGLSNEKAIEYIKGLKKSRRYLEDVY
ncbi:MAG: assimilatory sulfite reductase (NADPH) flavoprotein subunit [Saprospiraceae bacterium]|nr:assimilatory sulfite reductase (NADPH) flavoprotein subunit [Saprospiraceae bacterium]